jgi:nodulation protein E
MKRVVVTGLGCVSGLGADLATNWAAAVEGRGAIRPLHMVPEGETDLSIACVGAPVVAGALDRLARSFEERRLASVDRFSNFAAAATLEALEDSGLKDEIQVLDRCAIIYGGAAGGNASIEMGYQRMFYARLANIHPMTIPRYMNSAAVSHLSMLFGIRGHCITVSSACASSAHAISEAVHYIRAGRGPVVVAGGSDASLTFGSLHGWRALQAMAPDTCRPFSINRKGMVIGEGAATLILEDEAHARARGARIYAELAGSGSTADARHITQPDPENAAFTIREAHRDAGISDTAPMLISSHGTGTRVNDRAETQALRAAYQKTLGRHRVIATKSAHGHMLAAGGAMELLLALMAARKRVAPPILGYLGPDPDCDLPLALHAEPFACEVVVSTSFAFGGLNCVLIAKIRD